MILIASQHHPISKVSVIQLREIINDKTMITIEYVITNQLDYKTDNIANVCNLTSLTITSK